MEYNFLLLPKIETVNETIDILGTLYFDNRLYWMISQLLGNLSI